MKFVAGDVSGTVQGVTHIQTDEGSGGGRRTTEQPPLGNGGLQMVPLERTNTVAEE